MKKSKIIDIYLYKIMSLSKLYKELKYLDNNTLNKILQNKPFPDLSLFKDTFVKTSYEFNFLDGLMILKAYSEKNIIDLNFNYTVSVEFQQIEKEYYENKIKIHYSLLTKTFEIHRLRKELLKIDKSVLHKILQNKPFPKFQMFYNSVKEDRMYFNLLEGLMILDAYSNNKILDLEAIRNNEMRIERANKQNILFNKKNNNNLLGVTKPKKYKKTNKKSPNKHYSVWTVKK